LAIQRVELAEVEAVLDKFGKETHPVIEAL